MTETIGNHLEWTFINNGTIKGLPLKHKMRKEDALNLRKSFLLMEEYKINK